MKDKKKSLLFRKNIKINMWVSETNNQNISKLFASVDLENKNEQLTNNSLNLEKSLKIEKVPSINAALELSEIEVITPNDIASNIFLQKKLSLKLKKKM